jgi:hypothetical protein
MATTPIRIITDEPDLLASIREVYRRLPETWNLEAWEQQQVLWSLGYTDGLAPQADIATAIEVARADVDPDQGAA